MPALRLALHCVLALPFHCRAPPPAESPQEPAAPTYPTLPSADCRTARPKLITQLSVLHPRLLFCEHTTVMHALHADRPETCGPLPGFLPSVRCCSQLLSVPLARACAPTPTRTAERRCGRSGCECRRSPRRCITRALSRRSRLCRRKCAPVHIRASAARSRVLAVPSILQLPLRAALRTAPPRCHARRLLGEVPL